MPKVPRWGFNGKAPENISVQIVFRCQQDRLARSSSLDLAGDKEDSSYTFGMLDVVLPLCLTSYLPGQYTTRESRLTTLALKMCDRALTNGRSMKDASDELRELAEHMHAIKGLRYLGSLDLKGPAAEEKVRSLQHANLPIHLFYIGTNAALSLIKSHGLCIVIRSSRNKASAP